MAASTEVWLGSSSVEMMASYMVDLMVDLMAFLMVAWWAASKVASKGGRKVLYSVDVMDLELVDVMVALRDSYCVDKLGSM